MHLRDKVVVPELSSSTLDRVERRITAAVRDGESSSSILPDTLRRGFGTLAIGIAIAGVVVAVAVNLKGAFDSQPVVSSLQQLAPTEIVTGADAATIRLGEAIVTVAPNSEVVVIRRSGGETNLALRRGAVDCAVEPREQRPLFVVRAADVTVRVVGTVFRVELDPAASSSSILTSRVRVAVERGRVAVAASGSELFLDAGSQWTAAEGVTKRVAARPSRPERSQATSVAIATPTATDSLPAVAPVSVDPRKPREGTTKSRGEKTVSPDRGRSQRLPRPERLRPSSPSQELLAAMELETSDPRKAIAAYTAIATRTRGKLASFALYSRAYVELHKLGARGSALRTLDLFRRRFPRAREAESALWLQITALCGGGQLERCRSAAHSYARQFPSGRFLSAAQKIIDSL